MFNHERFSEENEDSDMMQHLSDPWEVAPHPNFKKHKNVCPQCGNWLYTDSCNGCGYRTYLRPGEQRV